MTPQRFPRAYDVVVVGSGIAGLYTALLASSTARVLLVTKAELEESNTRYAQGGIAVALRDDDAPELHLRDTVAAADGLADPVAARTLTAEAAQAIHDLLLRGVDFDREQGDFSWTREAAHSVPRVLHAHGDATGAEIERVLVEAVRQTNVDVLEQTFCLDLVRESSGAVAGIDVLHLERIFRVAADRVVLASGGAGQLFSRTTNPPVATGDGLAIACRAGAELMDLEFMQFHPTALALAGASPFLITEAARGQGGVLRGIDGERFMPKYHPDAELAPRDVVARAIHAEMQKSGSPHVLLDVTHLLEQTLVRGFPSVLAFCRSYGLDPVIEPIPVAPAAHYLMGGIRTNAWGQSSLPGLFACGEVACTGVHGANRLASNSLLEGLVFARRVARALVSSEDLSAPSRTEVSPLQWTTIKPSRGDREDRPSAVHDPTKIRESLRRTMWDDVGLVRSGETLGRARQALKELGPSTEAAGTEERENRNMRLVADLMVQAALLREESRGAHFREDFPQRRLEWQRHIILDRHGSWLGPAITDQVPAVPA